MNLLLYTRTFAPNIGGVETYMQCLAEGLIAAGHEVTVATLTAGGSADDETYTFNIVRLKNHGELAKYIDASDVVHIAGAAISPMRMCGQRGKPFVVEHHNYQSICPNGLLLKYPQVTACEGMYMQRKYRECLRCQVKEAGYKTALHRIVSMPIRRRLTKSANANVAVSQHVQARINLPEDLTIYHGLHPSEPKTTELTDELIFGYVGRLVPEKGLPVLLRACALLENEGKVFKLLMVGDGASRAELERQATREKLSQVEFTGFIEPARLSEVVKNIDVLIMASVWEETAGLVAIEQMHRGAAVIASDIGGLSEIVGDTAEKFQPGNVAALADAMTRFIDNPALVHEMGEVGRVRARSVFTVDRMVAEHIELYQRIQNQNA